MPTPPQPPARFAIELVEKAFDKCKCDVYLLETFPDGMTRWGNEEDNPFTGFSAVADTQDGHMTLSQVIYVLNRVDRAGHYPRVEEFLLAQR